MQTTLRKLPAFTTRSATEEHAAITVHQHDADIGAKSLSVDLVCHDRECLGSQCSGSLGSQVAAIFEILSTALHQLTESLGILRQHRTTNRFDRFGERLE